MKELTRSLRNDPSLKQHKWEDIKDSPELGSLYRGYIRSLAPADQTAMEAVLEKRAKGEPLAADEMQTELVNLTQFNRDLKEGEKALGNLEGKELSQLQEILKDSLPPNMSKEGLPLYIKGLAVRHPVLFARVSEEIRDWKTSARNEYREKQASMRITRLKDLASQMGIEKDELNRFIAIESPSERREEIFAALGGRTDVVGWFAGARNAMRNIGRTTNDLVTPRFMRNLLWPTDRLNKMIENYRAATGQVREGLGEVLGALSAVNDPSIVADPLWKEIPELLAQQSQKFEKGKGPMSLEEVQKESSADTVDDKFREKLRAIPGAEAEWDAKRRLTTWATPDDLWNETITGGTGTYADMLRGVTDEVNSGMKQRGWASSLIELLKDLLGDLFTESKNKLANHTRTR